MNGLSKDEEFTIRVAMDYLSDPSVGPMMLDAVDALEKLLAEDLLEKLLRAIERLPWEEQELILLRVRYMAEQRLANLRSEQRYDHILRGLDQRSVELETAEGRFRQIMYEGGRRDGSEPLVVRAYRDFREQRHVITHSFDERMLYMSRPEDIVGYVKHAHRQAASAAVELARTLPGQRAFMTRDR